MAREPKIGLDYYPTDIGFTRDDKFLLIANEFGPSSLWVILALWDKIYSDKGWYTYFDEDSCCLLYQSYLGVVLDVKSSKYLMEVVNGCCRRSLFDERVFKVFGVLTSKKIQKNYFLAKRETIKKRYAEGRKQKVWDEIFLLDEEDLLDMKMSDCFEHTNYDDFSRKISDNSGKCNNNSRKRRQRKVKKSKENNTNNKSDIRELFDSFESELGRTLSSIEMQSLSDLLDTHPPDLIIMALKESINNNVRSMNYVRAVLRNWDMAGVKNVDEAKKHAEEFRRIRKKTAMNRKDDRKLPDWYFQEKNGIEEEFDEASPEKIAEFEKMLEGMYEN